MNGISVPRFGCGSGDQSYTFLFRAEIQLSYDLSERDVRILKAGGLLEYTKKGEED